MGFAKWAVLGALAVFIIGAGFFFYNFVYGTGNLVIEITDPPEHWGSASNVYIRYSAIMIHRADAGNESGWFVAIESNGWVDLSTTLDVGRVIGSVSLKTGKYNLIRFEILEAVVTVGGTNYTADVESGKLNVAITKGGVNIQTDETTYLVIDISPKVVGSAKNFKIVPAAKAYPKTP